MDVRDGKLMEPFEKSMRQGSLKLKKHKLIPTCSQHPHISHNIENGLADRA